MLISVLVTPACFYLKKLPFDLLEIDCSLLALDRCFAPNSSGRSMLIMARSLKLDVVAQGVELPEQVEVLLSAGILLAQGGSYSKDLPAQGLAQFF